VITLDLARFNCTILFQLFYRVRNSPVQRCLNTEELRNILELFKVDILYSHISSVNILDSPQLFANIFRSVWEKPGMSALLIMPTNLRKDTKLLWIDVAKKLKESRDYKCQLVLV